MESEFHKILKQHMLKESKGASQVTPSHLMSSIDVAPDFLGSLVIELEKSPIIMTQRARSTYKYFVAKKDPKQKLDKKKVSPIMEEPLEKSFAYGEFSEEEKSYFDSWIALGGELNLGKITFSDFKKDYKRLCFLHHPDRQTGKSGAKRDQSEKIFVDLTLLRRKILPIIKPS